jgi:NADH-quinone oxidoreductase subunit N
MSPDAVMSWSSVAPAVGEIWLAVGICYVLLVDVFAGERHRALTPTLTLVVLAAAAALLVTCGHVTERTLLFNGLYIADELGFVLKLAALLVVAVALLYSRAYLESRSILRGEYYVLALTALLGIFVLISANSLLTVYLGVELLALSVYALVAFDRDSGIAAESAMKYFVLGAIASGALLYGMSLIYGLTGTLDLTQIAARLHAPLHPGVILGLTFIVVAVAFKLGAVPFHMWLPDVYEGAPTSVTLFIATVPKIAYFALTLRLVAYGLAGMEAQWSQMLAALAVLTLVVGNVVAIVQTNLKRMLAYSTIANVGFIVLGFVAGTPDGYAAALYYTLVYVLVALGSFGVILLAGTKGYEADRLDDYRGLYRRDPLLALVMMVLMFSTAGVPPFVGFWAKLRIFQALWESNHLWLVIIAAAMSVVGAFYYLRVIKLMYFDDPQGSVPASAGAPGVRWALGLNAAAVLALGLLPGPLLDLCARLIH